MPLGPAPSGNDLDGTLVRKSPQVRLAGYELVELIGQGAMGEVWKAVQISLGRPVALKMLPEKFRHDSDFVARFEKESAALAALSHPHIVQIIDRGEVDGRYFFAMEFVEGRSLRDLLNRGPLSCLEVLRIFRQLCDAVDYAHQRQIVHRDLKPENILVDHGGHVKVADLGLAGFRGEESANHALTATAVAMGTLHYMAPEQRRDARSVDGRADLYSLGVILYEMLTRELPIGRFKPPSALATGVDARVDAITLQLLETDRSARPARAAEVMRALAPVIAELETRPGASSAQPTQPDARASHPTQPAHSSVVKQTAGVLRKAMFGVGALVTTVFILRNVLGFGFVMDGNDLHLLHNGKVLVAFDGHHHDGDAHDEDLAPGQPSEDTNATLYTSGSFVSAKGTEQLTVDFAEGGGLALHAHAGEWKLGNGHLHARQSGDGPGGVLIPRAYLDDHLFSTQDFHAAVTVTAKRLSGLKEDDHQFAELALRFARLQVSVYAEVDSVMRLSWKYRAADGKWLSGSTDEAVAEGVADEVHVPLDRPARLELQMEPRPNGTLVTASLDGRPFAKRLLLGLQEAAGRVSLGCRNLDCTFSALSASSAEPAPLQLANAHDGED